MISFNDQMIKISAAPRGQSGQKRKRRVFLAAALSVLTGAGACQSKTESRGAGGPCAGIESGALGIVLEFKAWPPADVPGLSERLRREGLKGREDFPDFQSRSLSWSGCRERGRAEDACARLMSEFAAFLKSCSSDDFLEPA